MSKSSTGLLQVKPLGRLVNIVYNVLKRLLQRLCLPRSLQNILDVNCLSPQELDETQVFRSFIKSSVWQPAPHLADF